MPADTTLANFNLRFEAAGFIPLNSSYRINYESSLAGLPFEYALGIDFPINNTVSSSFSVRYRRRTALFVPDLVVSGIEIEPGIRAYLEKAHPNDLRLFGTAGLLLVRSAVSGILDATHDGTDPSPLSVSKNYYNIGVALGLGIEYNFTTISSFFAGIRVGIYLSDPVRTGGLGNAGGVSFGFGYKYAIF